MKFGKYLVENKDLEWADNYINYDELKDWILLIQGKDPGAEARFLECLEKGWNKYKLFIDKWIHDFDDQNVTKQSIIPIIRMNAFMYVNQECLRKIIKKHDKNSDIKLSSTWEWKLNYKPFFKLLQVMKKVSKLYQDHTPNKGENVANANTGPIDATAANVPLKHSKYLVPRERIIPLICLIIQYLPIKIFMEGTSGESLEEIVNTVYLDNENMDVYNEVLNGRGHAENIQISFHGENPSTVIVEKTLQSDMLSEACITSESNEQQSIRGRFALQTHRVVDMLRGRNFVDAVTDATHYAALITAVQDKIAAQKLESVLNAEYKRITFAIPGSDKIRCDLELDITLNKQKRASDEWFTPKSNQSNSSTYEFPYIVLEVTMKGNYATKPPDWFDQLVTMTDLSLPQSFFSKFCHGSFLFNQEHAKVIPLWIEKHRGIFIKGNTPSLTAIEHTAAFESDQSGQRNMLQSPPIAKRGSNSTKLGSCTEKALNVVNPSLLEHRKSVENGEDVNDPDNEVGLGMFVTMQKRTKELGLNHAPQTPVSAVRRPSTLPSNTEMPSDCIGGSWCSCCGVDTGNVSAPQHPAHRAPPFQSALRPQPTVQSAESKLAFRVDHDEFISPTIFFANETTFLQWFNASVILCAVGLAMIAIGQQDVGIVLCAVSIVTVLYAIYSYHRRDQALRYQQKAFDYGDRFGPYFLTFGVLAAFTATMIIKN